MKVFKKVKSSEVVFFFENFKIYDRNKNRKGLEGRTWRVSELVLVRRPRKMSVEEGDGGRVGGQLEGV